MDVLMRSMHGAAVFDVAYDDGRVKKEGEREVRPKRKSKIGAIGLLTSQIKVRGLTFHFFLLYGCSLVASPPLSRFLS